eukprot:g47279.t1
MWGLSNLQIILPIFFFLLATACIIYRRRRQAVYVSVRPIGPTYPRAQENLEISTNSPPTPVQPSPKHTNSLPPHTPVSHCPLTCPECRKILGVTHEQMLQEQMVEQQTQSEPPQTFPIMPCENALPSNKDKADEMTGCLSSYLRVDSLGTLCGGSFNIYADTSSKSNYSLNKTCQDVAPHSPTANQSTDGPEMERERQNSDLCLHSRKYVYLQRLDQSPKLPLEYRHLSSSSRSRSDKETQHIDSTGFSFKDLESQSFDDSPHLTVESMQEPNLEGCPPCNGRSRRLPSLTALTKSNIDAVDRDYMFDSSYSGCSLPRSEYERDSPNHRDMVKFNSDSTSIHSLPSDTGSNANSTPASPISLNRKLTDRSHSVLSNASKERDSPNHRDIVDIMKFYSDSTSIHSLPSDTGSNANSTSASPISLNRKLTDRSHSVLSNASKESSPLAKRRNLSSRTRSIPSQSSICSTELSTSSRGSIGDVVNNHNQSNTSGNTSSARALPSRQHSAEISSRSLPSQSNPNPNSPPGFSAVSPVSPVVSVTTPPLPRSNSEEMSARSLPRQHNTHKPEHNHSAESSVRSLPSQNTPVNRNSPVMWPEWPVSQNVSLDVAPADLNQNDRYSQNNHAVCDNEVDCSRGQRTSLGQQHFSSPRSSASSTRSDKEARSQERLSASAKPPLELAESSGYLETLGEHPALRQSVDAKKKGLLLLSLKSVVPPSPSKSAAAAPVMLATRSRRDSGSRPRSSATRKVTPRSGSDSAVRLSIDVSQNTTTRPDASQITTARSASPSTKVQIASSVFGSRLPRHASSPRSLVHQPGSKPTSRAFQHVRKSSVNSSSRSPCSSKRSSPRSSPSSSPISRSHTLKLQAAPNPNPPLLPSLIRRTHQQRPSVSSPVAPVGLSAIPTAPSRHSSSDKSQPSPVDLEAKRQQQGINVFSPNNAGKASHLLRVATVNTSFQRLRLLDRNELDKRYLSPK